LDPLDSFGLVPGFAGLYKQIATGLIGPSRRTHSASPVPGSSRRTSSVVTTQIFVGVDGTDYRRPREQRQTEVRGQIAEAGKLKKLEVRLKK